MISAITYCSKIRMRGLEADKKFSTLLAARGKLK